MCVSEPRQPLLSQDVFVSAAEDEQHPVHGSAHGSDVRQCPAAPSPCEPWHVIGMIGYVKLLCYTLSIQKDQQPGGMRNHILNYKQKAASKVDVEQGYGTLPSARLHSLPRQCHQLGTKCSHT